MNAWLKKHAFSVKAVSFVLMMLLPIGLYFSARAGSSTGIWIQLALVAASHLMLIRLK